MKTLLFREIVEFDLLVLFEKENALVRSIEELKKLYLRIKDFEFEGGTAAKNLYEEFAALMKHCEYEDELVVLKRNQILNNFETVCNDMFVKYFGQRGKMAVYDPEQLIEIVKKSSMRANDLKMSLRDLPKQIITDQDIDKMMQDVAKDRNPNKEPLVLVSRKQGETIADKSMIITGIRKNILQYGVTDGLKVSNAALIPESLLKDN